MPEISSSLPTYDSAPLIERVVSIVFSPVSELTNAHLGAFWADMREEWPRARHEAPIPSQIEVFESRWSPPTFDFAVSADPSCRVQMFDSADRRLIQIQRDRFACNWKREAGDSSYPRFSELRREFEHNWEKWTLFCHQLQLSNPLPQQWEITYVNRVKWDDLKVEGSDWSIVLPGWSWPLTGSAASGIDLKPYGRRAHWLYNIGVNLGRLHVEVDPAKGLSDTRNNDFMLRLTARGPIVSNVMDGIDLGHRTIVSAFDGMISAEARNAWKRVQP